MKTNSDVPANPSQRSAGGEINGQTGQPRAALRLWLPTVVLALYWLVVEGSFRLEMAMFPRFITRMLAVLVLLLFFLCWGLTRQRFTRGQRWTTLSLILGFWVVASVLNDPARNMMAMVLGGFPSLFTLGIAWLWLTPHRPPRNQLAGIKLLAAVVFGTGALIRWDGLDGSQRTHLSWRWTPTAEQQFLREHAAATSAGEPVPVTPQADTADSAELRAAAPGDWPAFRGGEKQGVLTGLTLADWSQSAPTLRWRRRVGPAWSSVAAVHDRLYTQEQRGSDEAVVCYDAESGKELWASRVAARFDEPLSGAGPRATPTWSDGRIYAYGATGVLTCLSAATGQTLWSKDVLSETGGAVPQWGLSVSPLIVDGLVVVFAGGAPRQGVVAFKRDSGDPIWQCPAGKLSFSSPQLVTIAGVRQIVVHDDAGLRGIDIADGHSLWEYPSSAGGRFQPMLQPHSLDETDLLVGWENGVRRLHFELDGQTWQIGEVWHSNRLKPGFNDFHIHRGFVYGLDDGILCCVDLADGQRRWKGGRYGTGQLLLLADLNELLVLGETGDVARVAAEPAGYRELASFHALDGKTWNHPLVAHGRLIVRNAAEMACFDCP